MTRIQREGYEAAAEVFGAAGFECEPVYGGKHLLCVARRGDVEVRHPIPGTPRLGLHGGVKLSVNSAKRRLRRLAEP